MDHLAAFAHFYHVLKMECALTFKVRNVETCINGIKASKHRLLSIKVKSSYHLQIYLHLMSIIVTPKLQFSAAYELHLLCGPLYFHGSFLK